MADLAQPVTALYQFIEEGRQSGRYTGAQAQNLKMSLRIALAEAAEKREDDPERMTIEQFSPLAKTLIRWHGERNPGTNEKSLQAYDSRLKRLLADYSAADVQVRHADAVAKPASIKYRVRLPKERTTRASPATSDASATGDTTAYDLRLPTGGHAELRVPVRTTKGDIAAMWKQLEALKALLEARADVDETETPPGKEAGV